MPDLTPEPMAVCTSLYGEHTVLGSKGDKYTVTCGDWAEWSCTCPAFKFHPDQWCKHIRAVRNSGCGWHELLDGGRVNDDGNCPRCGHEVEWRTVMV